MGTERYAQCPYEADHTGNGGLNATQHLGQRPGQVALCERRDVRPARRVREAARDVVENPRGEGRSLEGGEPARAAALEAGGGGVGCCGQLADQAATRQESRWTVVGQCTDGATFSGVASPFAARAAADGMASAWGGSSGRAARRPRTELGHDA